MQVCLYHLCNNLLPEQKSERGHRKREYCSDRCRQRACREQNKGKRDFEGHAELLQQQVEYLESRIMNDQAEIVRLKMLLHEDQ